MLRTLVIAIAIGLLPCVQASAMQPYPLLTIQVNRANVALLAEMFGGFVIYDEGGRGGGQQGRGGGQRLGGGRNLATSAYYTPPDRGQRR